MRRLLTMIFGAAIALISAGSALAAESGAGDWVRADMASARLVSAVSAVGDGGAIPLGVQIQLQPGWKTYWRSPGDAGLPVRVDWAGSTNLAGADMKWPVPHRFTLFGLETFGYGDEVVFPVIARPERPGEPMALRARIDYLVCEAICVPLTAELALDLPAGPAAPTPMVQLIDRFRVQVPGDGSAHGLGFDSVRLGGEGEGVLTVVARSTIPFTAPDLIVEGPPGLYFAAPDVAIMDDGHRAILSVKVGADKGAPAFAQAPLTLTLVDGSRGLERALAPGEAVVPGSADGLLAVLALAVLGGLVLNLMPCVLPVLSLKLAGALGLAGAPLRQIRTSFLATAAGILAAFLALALALALLKAAGIAIGWGFQFQQPVFLAAMIVLLTLFACNLWGWFDVAIPGWVGDAAARGGRPSLAGSFFTGIMATLLATPCSAPFVGTAVGFALARGPVEIVAIMLALGVGLAAPYFAVAAWPRLVTLLPRPGGWMLWFRFVLGLALAGTAIWLLTILAAGSGGLSVGVVAAAMILAAGALWARRRWPKGLRLASPAAVGLLSILALAASAGLGRDDSGTAAPDRRWTAFDTARISELVVEGRIVFVDVTAEWCITCLVNKGLVLDTERVSARLARPDVVAMQADWTLPSDAIAHYLASFGRYGIPFNAVYGPSAPGGIALPELLSEEAVLDAVRAAGG